GAGSNSGDLKNTAATASLLSLNSASSIVQLNNTTLRVTWQIRFENTFPTAADNVYLAVVSKTPGGSQISQDPQGIGAAALNYDKLLTWRTDLAAPVTSVSAPTTTGPNSFTVNWASSDVTSGNNGLLDVRSYCYTSSLPVSIIDNTIGQQLNLDQNHVAFPA